MGAGGMGEVDRARDTRLDRIVAVKVLSAQLSDNPEAKERFDREARALSSLNHPNICHLYDVDVQDGTSYLEWTAWKEKLLPTDCAAVRCLLDRCSKSEAKFASGWNHVDGKLPMESGCLPH